MFGAWQGVGVHCALLQLAPALFPARLPLPRSWGAASLPAEEASSKLGLAFEGATDVKVLLDGEGTCKLSSLYETARGTYRLKVKTGTACPLLTIHGGACCSALPQGVLQCPASRRVAVPCLSPTRATVMEVLGRVNACNSHQATG